MLHGVLNCGSEQDTHACLSPKFRTAIFSPHRRIPGRTSYLFPGLDVFVQHFTEFQVGSIPFERFLPSLLEELLPIVNRAKLLGAFR